MGERDEFIGLWTTESILDGDGKEIGTKHREIRIDDVNAQQIINLLTGHSEFKNRNAIKISKSYSKDVKQTSSQYFNRR